MLRFLPLGLLALLLICTGCATVQRRPAPPPRPSPAQPATAGRSAQIVTEARRQIGRPYRLAGESPAGFDCSGLVWYAYHRAGLNVPRTTGTLFQTGRPVPADQLQPGDLVFFRLGPGTVSHVGIYVGQSRMIHAPRPGATVREESLRTDYWQKHYVGARRLL